MKTYKEFILECKKSQEINEVIAPLVRGAAMVAKTPVGKKVMGAAASTVGKFLNKVRVGKMMRQPTQVFDQDVTRGWRSLPTDRSREAALRLYSRRNPNSVDSTMRFHLGQMQAMQGKNPQAIRNMNASKNPNDPQWTPYVDATTAFLKKNRKEFDKAAMRPNYNQAAIERLRQGFDKPYKDAY